MIITALIFAVIGIGFIFKMFDLSYKSDKLFNAYFILALSFFSSSVVLFIIKLFMIWKSSS